MSEMVERVARAIHEAADDEAGEGEYMSYAMARAAAIAAIEAMREPTEGMLDSGWQGLPEVAPTKGDYEAENAVMVDIWQEMIDAALGIERDRQGDDELLTGSTRR